MARLNESDVLNKRLLRAEKVWKFLHLSMAEEPWVSEGARHSV